jgi:hypothetical protein
MSLQVSYVVVTDTFATIRDVARAVRASSIAADVELIVVCPSARELGLDSSETSGIGAVRIIEFGPVIPLSPARAAGIRAATCALVFVGETHSFPAEGCLEALVAAHRSGDYAAVTPVIENANPQKALSWAGLMLTYRHWLEPVVRQDIDVLSTYNACFRRDALVHFGERLTAMLDYGSGLDAELRARGEHFLIEPAARLMHLNVAALSGWLPERFLSGRFWATARSRKWSTMRRLAYVLGSPLIPIMIAGRAIRSPQWAHHVRRMPRGTLALVILSAVVTAAGELAAYVAGEGQTPIWLAEYELHRARYL